MHIFNNSSNQEANFKISLQMVIQSHLMEFMILVQVYSSWRNNINNTITSMMVRGFSPVCVYDNDNDNDNDNFIHTSIYKRIHCIITI